MCCAWATSWGYTLCFHPISCCPTCMCPHQCCSRSRRSFEPGSHCHCSHNRKLSAFFYLNLFTFSKLNQGINLILDLKILNLFKEVKKCLHRIRFVIGFLTLWTSRIHTCSTCFYIFMLSLLLSFAVGTWQYQFVALLFGLLAAPRVFTKVLAAVLALLCSWSIPIVGYQHNLLLREESTLVDNTLKVQLDHKSSELEQTLFRVSVSPPCSSGQSLFPPGKPSDSLLPEMHSTVQAPSNRTHA